MHAKRACCSCTEYEHRAKAHVYMCSTTADVITNSGLICRCCCLAPRSSPEDSVGYAGSISDVSLFSPQPTRFLSIDGESQEGKVSGEAEEEGKAA